MNKIAYLQGYMNKEALDYTQMERAFEKSVAPYLLKGKKARFLHWLNGVIPYTGIRNIQAPRFRFGAGTVNIKKALKDRPGVLKQVLDNFKGWREEYRNPVINLDDFSSRYLADSAGKKIGGYKKLDKKSRKLLKYLSGLHEYQELRSPVITPELLKFNYKTGHMSPKVLMVEHNLVTSLPDEYKRVKTLMRLFRRQSKESAYLADKLGNGFVYGKSPIIKNMNDKVKLFEEAPYSGLTEMKKDFTKL